MPEILGGVLIAAFLALYLLILLLKEISKVLIGSVTSLWNHMTGETARREEQYRRNREAEEEGYRRVRQAEEQFGCAILTGRYPSKEVLAIITKESIRLLPGDLRKHFGWTEGSYEDAAQRIREEMRVNKERASATCDYKELAESFAQLVESCSVPWDELTRIAKAMHGPHDSWPFAKYVHWNILQILSVMSEANGSVPRKLAGIYQVLSAQLEPKVYVDLNDCVEKISTCKHNPLGLPLALEPLRPYDQLNGANLTHQAAISYRFLVKSAAWCCADSRPTAIIEAAYLELLKPFLSVNGSNGSSDDSSRDGSDGNSTANSSGNCPKCVKYYPLLRLKPDASERDIKTAYRDLAQIYHPDRFEGHNERVRRTAEDHLKSVNVAYGHIIGHFESRNR